MGEEKSKPSRRAFFEKLALLGTGAIAGAGVLYTGYKYEHSKDPQGKVRLLTADNKIVEVDASALQAVKPSAEDVLQTQGREGIKGRKWVMIVDLAKCRNARKCVNSCQNAHDLAPGQYHMNVLQMQDSPDTAPYNMPKPCQHCDNPPCVSVCPVDATFKRQDGIVLIDNERCIGCRFCMAACPYNARIFHWVEPKVPEGHKNKPYDIELNVPQKKGTISKCLFSADRLREEKLPYCVSACPNGVYWFGDENEDAVTNGTTKETTRMSELLEKNGGYQLMPELGTKPRVYYLPPKNRLFPFEKKEDPIEKQES
jgi:molybdopterin-containing oxidoreductase family iron-sulfur binding subunit